MKANVNKNCIIVFNSKSMKITVKFDVIPCMNIDFCKIIILKINKINVKNLSQKIIF